MAEAEYWRFTVAPKEIGKSLRMQAVVVIETGWGKHSAAAYPHAQLARRASMATTTLVPPIPFVGLCGARAAPQPTDVLVVDCTDPDARHPHMLTHHKGQNVPAEVMADTSSGSVINALLYGGGAGHPVVHGCRGVTTNHFDIDSFVSVWCAQNPEAAVANQAVLRRAAHIGDFRELGDMGSAIERRALALCCWLNTQERLHFYRPFAEEEELGPEPETEQLQAAATKADGTLDKFGYFLARFADVLRDPDAYRGEWEGEYLEVEAGVAQLADTRHTSVYRWPEAGLVAVHTAEPVHYYALFSVSAGFDAVLAMYGGRDGGGGPLRVELESKYTQFVNLVSRDVPPRLDLAPLATRLNRLERQAGRPRTAEEVRWVAEDLGDPGPVLRLEQCHRALSHAERYVRTISHLV
jgi:hypothetical protein